MASVEGGRLLGSKVLSDLVFPFPRSSAWSLLLAARGSVGVLLHLRSTSLRSGVANGGVVDLRWFGLLSGFQRRRVRKVFSVGVVFWWSKLCSLGTVGSFFPTPAEALGFFRWWGSTPFSFAVPVVLLSTDPLSVLQAVVAGCV